MSDIPGEEECWACGGYGDLRGRDRVVYCPWCRGTGVLFVGAHEHGESCDCHLGRNFKAGDDWFEFTRSESDGMIVARLPRDPDLAERIRQSIKEQQEG